MINYMRTVMAYQERRIPSRPSPRAPPPPRSLPTPQPEYTKPRRRIKTKEDLKRSQVRTVIVMIFFFVLLVVAIYLSTVLISNEVTMDMEKGVTQHDFEFNVQNIMSQDMPVEIEVEASEPVEFYILEKNDYELDMDIVKLRNASINRNFHDTTRFEYKGELEPGTYKIVSYLRFEKEQDITLNYKITRFILMPILWLITLLLMIPVIICIAWIFVLQKRKAHAPLRGYDPASYDHPDRGRDYYDGGDGYGQPEPHEGHYDRYGADYDMRHSQGQEAAHPRARHPPEYYDHEHDHDYAYEHDRAQGGVPGEPMARPPRQHSGRPQGAQYARHGLDEPLETPHHAPPPRRAPPPRENAHTQAPAPVHTAPAPEPVIVPCKCGEAITVTDETRPLRIKCPRCGRRGILEGKPQSPEDDIFY